MKSNYSTIIGRSFTLEMIPFTATSGYFFDVEDLKPTTTRSIYIRSFVALLEHYH